ncbi:hypothetical protein K466DRAFT_557244 [Polyporus arcularius HHB13444]|uniref:Uncharacterized protein n=1 Tax=Polyporus arcularius HHB13444 TaxID=1314778 RepID=A0A5C3P844_9APHY|nr:hypothetical protein K466DRAFT_557244 [Polyporus arcularius HHB13444]
MSSTNTAGAGNTFATQPPPTHHTHKSSDVLPGARGASQAAQNYSTDVTENPRVWQDEHERKYGAGSDTRAVVAGGQHDAPNTGSSAFEGERPMGEDADYFLAGGVAIGGEANLPEGHAKMTDKIIGKTQKLTGKMTHNAEMHEKGELREAGGKLAAQGQARAPHD